MRRVTPPPPAAVPRRLPRTAGTAHTPIWILRQAGRYLPEYRALREKHDFLTMMRTPELAAEATLQPIRRFPLDAAILFSDIMTPLDGLGLGLGFAPGPVLERPVRSAAAVDALRLRPNKKSKRRPVTCWRRSARCAASYRRSAPLIGFAGAPFTLFCYLVEGRAEGRRGEKGFPTARPSSTREPEAAARLLDKLAELSIAYLTAQARAGAQALMLFDSWAGLLSPEIAFVSVRCPVCGGSSTALEPLGLPRIYYLRSGEAASPLDDAADLPVEVVGID